MVPRQRSPNRDKAFEIYKAHGGKIENRRIAEMMNIPEKTIGGWKCKDKWDEQLNGVLQTKERSTPKPHGAPKGNKNAVGHKPSTPPGNLNALKHGAYQTIYTQFLPEEEKAIYEQMPADADLDNESRLLRLKISRLLNREDSHYYDMFGNRHDIIVPEENREKGIIACMKQLEKLIRTQEQLKLQREKLELEKAKQADGNNRENELADKLRGLIDELEQ